MTNFFITARSTRGFTLVETLVSVSIFAVIMGIVAQLFFNAFSLDRKTQIARVLFEESRIALERMVKEVRRGTLDYEEYWSWYRAQAVGAPVVPRDDSDYGTNYGWYATRFFRDTNGTSPAGPAAKTRFDENIGRNSGAVPIGNADTHDLCTDHPHDLAMTGYEQCQLFLITADGAEKTIIKLIPVDVGATREHRLAMLKLIGSDSTGDGQIDTFTPLPEFAGHTFQLIQPDSVNITELSFFVAPLEDPRKAFADFTEDVQIQPHVTIRMTAVPSVSLGRGYRGQPPAITLQTTVTARAQHEIVSLK